MILIIFRIFCRIFSQIPSHSKTTSYFSIIVSKYVHTLLYFFMIVMPLSGYMMSSASGKAIKIIFFDVPLIFTQNKSLAFLYNKIHTSSSYIITILIMLHVLGTFKHLIIDKENIFKRIT
ncbi:prokaryotic cytochrome b561 family protein [Candidatus Neoehrlichia lotoris str. RAC413]|uniref:Prokaryotic cytochrome b561 family protein n=2 Tax=Candidatus Neoehrlichia procyonis TaxID=467750 RepID=A0A0F3NRP8_9RICK|nr:prokaryotic cytochrome b561 family protein [Candidatus Neoehrlichia lotoris str. RAC413]